MLIERCQRLTAKDASEHEDLFRIDWRSCRFGGKRPYAHCPRCPRTVLHLYPSGDWFACRSCLRLTYASQREGGADRRRRAARKVRAKLKAGDNLLIPVMRFPRPKYMQQRTWLRLRQVAMRLEMSSLADMQAFVEKLRKVKDGRSR